MLIVQSVKFVKNLRKSMTKQLHLHLLQERLIWHLINLCISYILMDKIGIFSLWNIFTGTISGVFIYLFYFKNNKYEEKKRAMLIYIRIYIEWVQYIELFIFPLIIHNYDDPLMALLPLAFTCKLFSKCPCSKWVKIGLLITNMVINIYNMNYFLRGQELAILMLLLVFHIYITISLFQIPADLNKASTKAKSRAKQTILDAFPLPIFIYNKSTTRLIMNNNFIQLLKRLKCKDFEDFTLRCRERSTNNVLMDEIYKQIGYFETAILNKVTQVKKDFVVKGINTYFNKELEIEFCKYKRNSLIVILREENNNDIKKEQIIRRYKHVISKTICHDLRTPLNGILTPLEQLESSEISPL